MRTTALAEKSLFGLLRQLPADAKVFLKDEVQLAKSELGEKVSCLTRNAVSLTIGGVIAYAGAIVLLGALGLLLGRGLQALGLEPELARGTGLGIIGLLCAALGGAY